MIIKPWTIYLWRNGDKYEGASPIITKDGIKEIFCHGWRIEKDPEARRNEDKHNSFRAKIKVKNLLNNTLNVINWYGKKVLDDKGNISTEKLRILEANVAMQAVKSNERIKILNKNLPKGKKLEEVDMSDLYPIKKFPQEEITLKEAIKYGFVGDLIQKHYVNKHL